MTVPFVDWRGMCGDKKKNGGDSERRMEELLVSP